MGIEKKYDVTALGELLIDFTESGLSEQGNKLLEVNPGGAPCNVLAMLNKAGRKVAFMGLMTPKGMTVDQYLASLTGSDFVEGYKNRKSSDVTVKTKMPEFKYDYGASLVDAMKSLGITDAFDGYAADFSGISDYPLKISDIIHKTHIDVDRNGTRAAAVTIVEMDKATAVMEEEPPVMITLDRPFVYAIVEAETGLPVFLGIVNTVE